ncbi:MAG: hypothetical protein KKC79_21030 [Gammaproteobacteria bacterium]|nr:hypothetical protein [Gammaproteobacteria bacterium]MBU1443175.1 hypothetical protein [Gammaproteobacteria bacterium]MBU2285958.1 hypothetical protein [Gammaproteobacteria bacterium]MBU2411122.1 hypothetical protein [Gammaproteobacteria bacterium]
MPSTVPYDPSLVLGNLVHPDVMELVTSIAALQAPIDAAQDTLNSFISMKRSIDMTVQELINMKVDPKDLMDKSAEVGESITKAAVEYAALRIKNEQAMQPLRAKIQGVQVHLESPIDYVRSAIKEMPLSADSIKMDAQYFSLDGNEEQVHNSLSSIKTFITGAAEGNVVGWKAKASTDISTSAIEQINQQRQQHKIEGTLIVTATCTHKKAKVLAPLYMNVDKAIRVWNRVFSDDADKINMNDVGSMQRMAKEEGTSKEKFLSLLSGATFGSSFVGMVHILRTNSTTTMQKMNSSASSFQAQADIGCWYAQASGGFGLAQSFADDIKNLLSTANVTSHISVISMGCIPTITANSVKTAVKQFGEMDPNAMMGQLVTLNNATNSEKTSLAEAANASRTGQQMVELQGATIENVISALSKTDEENNKVLDINSMMTAFEDFVAKAIEGDVGVPINYYIKDFTRAQIANMWINKYFPSKYLTFTQADDSAAQEKNDE